MGHGSSSNKGSVLSVGHRAGLVRIGVKLTNCKLFIYLFNPLLSAVYELDEVQKCLATSESDCIGTCSKLGKYIVWLLARKLVRKLNKNLTLLPPPTYILFFSFMC